jgi:aldehyde:ferredoxin oxidoreductase
MTTAGTILRIDLSNSEIKREPTAPYIKDWIGGALMGAKLYWDEVPPGTRALDPRNLLMFNTGPLTGTFFGNKVILGSKTPERANNPYCFVGMGGQFPSELKFAGYDHVLIKGRAEHPVYLSIDNDRVEIRDARHLWGLDAHETQRRIQKELGSPDVKVACVGPAGENCLVYAMIVHDIQNTASRKVGPVMGSKNLKAIAVRGTKGLKIADPKEFLRLFDLFYDEFREGGRAWAFGQQQNREGISRQIVEGYKFAYGTEVPDGGAPPSPTMDWVRKHRVGSIGCSFCPLQCHQNFSVPGVGNGGTTCVNYFGLYYQRMYEADDYDAWWERTMLANRYGIDTLSIEMIGGWLMELYRRGIITAEDTDGVPMVKGSREAIRTVIEKLARAEGFGKLFTEGIASAGRTIGKGSFVYADQYDNAFPYSWADVAPDLGPVARYRTGEVERVPGFADGYGNIPSFADILGISLKEARNLVDRYASDAAERITGDRDVWRKQEYSPHASAIIIEKEGELLAADILGHCEVTSRFLEHYGCDFGFEHYAEWLSAATGIEYTPDGLRGAAHKLRALVDSYNALCAEAIGEEPAVSIPLEKLTVFPQPGRPTDGKELKKHQTEYCNQMGYDPVTGRPTAERLNELQLGFVADQLAEVFGPLEPEPEPQPAAPAE